MRKKLYIGSMIFVIFVIFLIFIIRFIFNSEFNDEKYNINIYYLSTSTNQLVPQLTSIDFLPGDVKEEYNAIWETMSLLRDSSENQNLVTAIPEDLEVLSYTLNENILQINFSDIYNDLKETEEIFCRAALVWTFTEFDFIDGIEILVLGVPLMQSEEKEMGILNRANVLINPVINPDKIETEMVTLYFSDLMSLYLISETRFIEVKQSDSIEKQIVEQLIIGPQSDELFPTIPTETKIRNIKTEDGICYVDLSSEFVSYHTGGSSAEILTIYSIVNSLTDLDYVDSVQIFIEGEKVTTFNGHLDISKPFERNEEIIFNEII